MPSRATALLMVEELPPEVRDLVARRLQGMEEVEVLLLLASESAALSVSEIRERLRLPASSLPMASVDRLVANDLLAEETVRGERRFRYAPATSELRRAVQLLGVAYNQRPVTLIRLVYHRPSPAQSFADAFRVRKDDDR
jgi:hypothetical protein